MGGADPAERETSTPKMETDMAVRTTFTIPLFVFTMLDLVFLVRVRDVQNYVRTTKDSTTGRTTRSATILPMLGAVRLGSSLMGLVKRREVREDVLGNNASTVDY